VEPLSRGGASFSCRNRGRASLSGQLGNILLGCAARIVVAQALNASVAMIGMMLYLQYLKLERPAIILASVLFGYAVFLDTFVLNKGATFCWLPLIVYLSHRLLISERREVCRSRCVSCALVSGGWPNYFLYWHYLIRVLSPHNDFLLARL